MTRRKSARTIVGDVTSRGLRARACGARMFAERMDWMTMVADRMDDPSAFLTDDELGAYERLTPAMWWVSWWRGWNDAAEQDR